MTLRRKLVILIVAVVILVTSAIAVILSVSLRNNLYGQLDDELRAANNRAVNRPGYIDSFGRVPSFPSPSEDQESDGDTFDRVPAGQAAGTINVAYVQGLAFDAGYIDEFGEYQYLTQEQFDVLDAINLDGDIESVKVPQIGSFHAISAHDRNGNRTVTAMSTSNVSDSLRVFTGLSAVLIGLATTIAGSAGFFFIKRSLRPLDSVARAATQVSELPLDKGEVSDIVRVPEILTDESTEVGKVGAAFNRMIGHVESSLSARQNSETQVRQFVADASHELRTPLASIRGYAELVRRSKDVVPESTSLALSRIESESIRMTALVEDMLLLAHLDAGRELATDTVDLSMLAILTLSDAHAAGPDHVWQLELPEEPCEVVGDESRLQQVLVNLLANSRVHTPAGTTVTLAITPDTNGDTLISVRNNGPAIAPELLNTMFQRFSRGDEARNRTGGSTGLGLAIAHAIVVAHLGTITATSAPEQTEFQVFLPHRFPAAATPTAKKVSKPPLPPAPQDTQPN